MRPHSAHNAKLHRSHRRLHPGKANWLTDGGDNQRTAWQKNETLITKDSVKNMKLLWKLQLDNQPRQMHNLFPPLIVSDVTTAQGPKDIARRRRRLRQRLRHRHRHGHAALVAEIRQHVRRADRRPRRRRAVSRRADRDAGHRPDRHRRASTSSTRSPGMDACARSMPRPATDVAPAGAVPAAERQAVRPEPVQERHLHDDGAGLRRQSRTQFYGYDLGDEEGRPASCPGSGGMWPRTGPSIGKDGTRLRRQSATATTIPSGRSTARRSSA